MYSLTPPPFFSLPSKKQLYIVFLVMFFSFYFSAFASAQNSTVQCIYIKLNSEQDQTNSLETLKGVIDSVPGANYSYPFSAASSEYLKSVILLTADNDYDYYSLEIELANLNLCDLLYVVKGELTLNGSHENENMLLVRQD
jgi:hypothetical protein